MSRQRKLRIGRLDTVGYIACELARVYRQARRGELDVADASRLATILVALRSTIEASDFERRLDVLEERLPKADVVPLRRKPW